MSFVLVMKLNKSVMPGMVKCACGACSRESPLSGDSLLYVGSQLGMSLITISGRNVYINPHVNCSKECNNLLNIYVNGINKFTVTKLYCWLGKQKGLFSVQWCCSPNFNPTMHSVVWEGMVANHGVSFDTQQAMGYIAKIWAENPKEDKNLITESNKIITLKFFEVNNKFVIRICEKD